MTETLENVSVLKNMTAAGAINASQVFGDFPRANRVTAQVKEF